LYNFYIFSLILTLSISSKRNQRFSINCFFSVLASCTVISLFNELIYSFLFGFLFVRLRVVSRSLPKGNSLSPHSSSSINLKNKLRIYTPFFVWDCKGRHFFLTSKLFSNYFLTFSDEIIPEGT